jgi:hypothetical protein
MWVIESWGQCLKLIISSTSLKDVGLDCVTFNFLVFLCTASSQFTQNLFTCFWNSAFIILTPFLIFMNLFFLELYCSAPVP